MSERHRTLVLHAEYHRQLQTLLLVEAPLMRPGVLVAVLVISPLLGPKKLDLVHPVPLKRSLVGI